MFHCEAASGGLSHNHHSNSVSGFGDSRKVVPRIKGVFTGATDSFDPARHRVDVDSDTTNDTVQKNKPSQLVFLVPSLPPATYDLLCPA